MSRRRAAEKREAMPDARHGDRVVAKFMSVLMYDGKKSVAEHIVYGAFENIHKRTSQDPVKVFHDALSNVKPDIEVRSRRVGGATYQVPVEVRPARRVSLGMRWIVLHARTRPEKSMVERLAGEINDAANNRGAAIKKREDTHRMAEANKAFAHYRW